MRPKQPERTDQDDLFKTRLDTFINLKHEFVQLADKLDWDWIDEQLADCFSDQGRPAEPVRFMIRMLMLKEIYIAILQFACARLTVSLARALLKTKGCLYGGHVGRCHAGEARYRRCNAARNAVLACTGHPFSVGGGAYRHSGCGSPGHVEAASTGGPRKPLMRARRPVKTDRGNAASVMWKMA